MTRTARTRSRLPVRLRPVGLAASTFAWLSTSALPCTFFMCEKNGVVLAGNNEDWQDPNTKMWFIPAEGGSYGRVYFGFGNGFPQGGMNDQGLFFDGAATPNQEVVGRPQEKQFSGNIVEHIMETCATVEEVITVFESYDVPQFFSRAQLQFADALGDSMIIEGRTIHRKEPAGPDGSHQITTNFYQSKVNLAVPPCDRYRMARTMLSKEEPSVDLVRRVLKATHQEGEFSTVYSNVYDLTNATIYLYHFHDFENAVVIHLDDELAKGRHEVELEALFPEKFAFKAFRHHYEQRQQESAN